MSVNDAFAIERNAGGAARASGVTVVSNVVRAIDLNLSDFGWHSDGGDRAISEFERSK